MEHQYCLFYKNIQLQFGWIKATRKNKLIVVPLEGKEFTCSQNRVEHVWKATEYQEDKQAIEYLYQKSVLVWKEAKKLDLVVIHELCEPGKNYTLEELADSFLDDPTDIWQTVALLLCLKNDHKLFQHRRNQFIARTKDEILRIEGEEEKKAEKEKRLLKEQEWAAKLLKSIHPVIEEESESHWQQFTHRLKNFLLYLEKSPEKEYFCKLLKCQITVPEIIESILLDCLAVTKERLSWGRLLLERVSIDFEYEENELAEVDRLSGLNVWENQYAYPARDQRDLLTYTVDNVETRDFDDAVSYEANETQRTIRIHIADVASFIEKDSYLFKKAEKRIATLYTVKSIYPMFHPNLSEHVFSLVKDKDRSVLTFEFILDEQNEIQQTDIYRSVINVNENLSYEEVNHAIDNKESFWPRLWQFCQSFKAKRMENGALELDRVEVKLDISDPENIKIKSTRENTAASMLIQELAILVNYQSAVFCKNNDLKCFFRNQPPYSFNRELEENVKPTLRDLNIQPARINLESDQHSALGLDCYLQVSSPIRRFHDLINQAIILRKLYNGGFGMSYEELLRLAKYGEEIQREYTQVERKLLDHWKIKFLAQNKDEIYDAQLVRYFRNGKASVNIIKLQLQVDMVMENNEEDGYFPVVCDGIIPKYNRVLIRRLRR